jgi:hypothetical protein
LPFANRPCLQTVGRWVGWWGPGGVGMKFVGHGPLPGL